jgi:hypothetical protein
MSILLVKSRLMKITLAGGVSKWGRGTAGNLPLFGLLRRDGKVYIKIISDAKSETFPQVV